MLWFKRKKKKRPLCGAVVAAAGSGTRMGEDKILMPLGDEPVIVHTLHALESSPLISEIVVVTRRELIVPVAQLCKDCGLTKVSKVVAGGATRLESVRLGTLELTTNPELIAVHDGARPFVTKEVIEAAVMQAKEYGAAAPAVEVTDTIRQVDADGLTAGSVDRMALRAVQTPQVFEEGLLRAALQKALEDGAEVTDDCAAVERLGMKAALTPGDPLNIKLTTPADLLLAQGILEGRETV